MALYSEGLGTVMSVNLSPVPASLMFENHTGCSVSTEGQGETPDPVVSSE